MRVVGVPPTEREDFFMATMLIDGQTVAAQTGKTIEVRNPANGEVVDTIPKGSASEVDAAVEAAAKALPAWASLSGTKRAAFMHAAAVKVKAAVPEIAKLLTLEQGKPLAEAIETGMISINHHGLALPELHFGGVKDSGYGTEGGSEAIEAYLSPKLITQMQL